MKNCFGDLGIVDKAKFEASCRGKHTFEKEGLTKTVTSTIAKTISMTRGVTVVGSTSMY